MQEQNRYVIHVHATVDDFDPRVDIVVVDDAEEVRAVVVQFLSLDGRFRVVAEGATGAEAVALAALHRRSVMILDASMPDVDGLTALPAVLEQSPGTRVALFSGFSGPVLASAARELGAADVIDKATPVRTLAQRLLHVAGRDGGGGHRRTVRLSDSAPDQAIEAEVEAALARHLERFRTVFDQGTIGMATMTLAGSIVRANPALCTMLGTAEWELVARSFTSITGWRDGVAIEHRLASPGERWLRSTVGTVRDTGGTPLYLFAQSEDITDRRLVREELRQSQERFRLLVEGVRDYAIFALDPDGHITTWNLGAERMKGYEAEEIIGKHFRVFYEDHARAVGHPEQELRLAIANGRYEEDGWRVRKDGSRFWANVVITPLFDQGGNLAGFAKVTRDVTERHIAAEAQEQFTAELKTANAFLKAAAQQTTEFVAMTAHELRSPIAAMTGAAVILRDYWDVLDAEQRSEALNTMLRGGDRLRRLIEDLLIVSRLEAGSFHFDLDSRVALRVDRRSPRRPPRRARRGGRRLSRRAFCEGRPGAVRPGAREPLGERGDLRCAARPDQRERERIARRGASLRRGTRAHRLGAGPAVREVRPGPRAQGARHGARALHRSRARPRAGRGCLARVGRVRAAVLRLLAAAGVAAPGVTRQGAVQSVATKMQKGWPSGSAYTRIGSDGSSR